MKTFLFLILASLLAFSDPLVDLLGKSGPFFGYNGGIVVGYTQHISYPFLPVDPVANLTECDPNFLKAVMKAESSFKIHAFSSANAMGVAQFIPSTADWIGLSNPFNPISATFKMCEYFKYLEKKFDTKEELLWAYHDGENRVRKHGPTRAGRIYSERVLEYYEEYSTYEKVEYFRDDIVFKVSTKFGTDFKLKFEMIGSILGFLDLNFEVDLPENTWNLRAYPRLFWYFSPYVVYDGNFEFGISIFNRNFVNLDVNPFDPSFEISLWKFRFGFDERVYVLYKF